MPARAPSSRATQEDRRNYLFAAIFERIAEYPANRIEELLLHRLDDAIGIATRPTCFNRRQCL